MATRQDGRQNNELRPVKIRTGFLDTAEGSCWIEVGRNRVLCTASFSEGVPGWINENHGWLTAEYAMLPKASKTRISREGQRPRGRTAEIQRLIGRALRSTIDLQLIGSRTITIDCDVIQADGGTRTAAITGGFVALWEACALMQEAGLFREWPIKEPLAAVSVGLLNNESLLDLCYAEDSLAAVDMNVVMTGSGRMVEIQAAAEKSPFSREQLSSMTDLAWHGICQLIGFQKTALAGIGPSEPFDIQVQTP